MQVEAIQDAVLSNGEAFAHFKHQYRTRELRVEVEEAARKRKEARNKSKAGDDGLKSKRDKVPENYKFMKENVRVENLLLVLC